MTDLVDLVAGLESRLVNAWPSFEVELVDGWLLRFAEGYSKRANSASPIAAGARLDAARAAHIRARFERRGLVPYVRLTGLEDPACDGLLEGLGWASYDPSVCLAAEVGPEGVVDELMQITPTAEPAWIAAAAAAYGGDKSNAGILGRIVGLIRQDAAFGTLRLDGVDVAWGLAVHERGCVGLYDIVVAPERRGLGLGRRLVGSLMAWGRQQGATRAYLQMRQTNAVAAALYASLGFREAYRYSHRMPPAGS